MKAKKSRKNHFVGTFLLDPVNPSGQMDVAKVMSHVLELKFRLGNNLHFQED